jgi:pimeloyl-ACP methyl ester carboxylesterase
MNSHRIPGGGNTELHVVETGNPQGSPILFIHGFSQSWFAWSRQLNSDLTKDHRLIAMDLRGHGLSEKPLDGYSESKLWADDVKAVIERLSLDRPVLCGWSYGPLVILDYVRHYGEDAIDGVHFVGGITKLGSDEAISVLAPDFLGLVAGFFSSDVTESVRSLGSLLRMCFAEELSPQDFYLQLGYNVSVPPYVRKALFSRSFDNDDLLPRLSKPVLISHGSADRIVTPAAAHQHKAGIPHARIEVMPDAGHGAFWDDPAAFNRHLAQFCRTCRAGGAQTAVR